MQKLITQNRMLMEEELSMMNEEERKPYIIYAEILEVIKATQGELDELDAVRRDRLYNMDQLEKCRKKYQELSKSKNGKNKRWASMDACALWATALLLLGELDNASK